MLSNFPVWLYDSDGIPDWPTFGLLLVEPKPQVSIGQRLPKPEPVAKGPRGVVTYVKALAQTMMEAHDRLYVESANYARTIPIPTLGVGTTAFDLCRERKLALVRLGSHGGGGLPEDLGLRRLHRDVPQRSAALPAAVVGLVDDPDRGRPHGGRLGGVC